MKQHKDDELWKKTIVALKRIGLLIKFLVFPFFETIRGILFIGSYNSQSFLFCILASAIPYTANAFGYDIKALSHLGLMAFYPKTVGLISAYRIFLLIYPYWIWGFYQMAVRERRRQKLRIAFENAGIKTKGDRYPSLVYDKPITPETFEMKLRKNGTNIDQFRNGKNSLESSANIYIDAFRDNIQLGTLSIVYGTSPLVSEYDYEEGYLSSRPNTFLIGKGRVGYHTTNLATHPHMLIAGVSGAGKSTFLRSLIVTLIQHNPDANLHVIDLKGGLEFNALLSGVQRTSVKTTTSDAIVELKELHDLLDARMSFLEQKGFTDISKYFRQESLESRLQENPRFAYREVVIIDECADLFLRGPHITHEDMNTARNILSRISRMGRAVGIHLIMATQRPDVNAIDSQVKSNLSGVVCFRTANLPSSMTILGNARATELPAEIKGRAIWRSDGEYFEVQTPYVTPERAKALLSSFTTADQKTEAVATKVMALPNENKATPSGDYDVQK